LSIRERLDSPDPEDVKAAMKGYAELVDRFYEIEENLAPPQYSGAKKDFEYLLRLLDLAILYHLPSDCQEHKAATFPCIPHQKTLIEKSQIITDNGLKG